MQAQEHSDNKGNGCSTITELFFHLVRCGIGKQDKLPYTPDAQEWSELFDIAEQQTLTGITFAGIEKLPAEQRPPKKILLSWHSACEQIKEKSIDLNKRCVAVSKKFNQLGFRNTVLKGQGVAQCYPTPNLRTPGDIDIWLEGGSERILAYIKKCFPKCKPTYHHVDFPISKEIEIEVHFTPSWMHNPFANRRLQRFFEENADRQFGNIIATAQGSFAAPTAAFNRVYILLHIYRHLFQEGIGLRQLLDYYFVLQQEATETEKKECHRLLRRFGLESFAAAATYVLQKIFGLETDRQIVAPDKRRGEFLLKEVMLAGNFGKHDSRYTIVSKEKEFAHFLNSMRRIARLIFQYPGEALWSPYFKTKHYFWRKKHQNRK